MVGRLSHVLLALLLQSPTPVLFHLHLQLLVAATPPADAILRNFQATSLDQDDHEDHEYHYGHDGHVDHGGNDQSQPLPHWSLDPLESTNPMNPIDHPHRRTSVIGGCMDDNFLGSNSVGCTANDISFKSIAGFEVHDDAAVLNPVTGAYDNACRGADDYVTVSFQMNFDVSGTKYDLGMYINVEGGNALNGVCTVARMTAGTFGGATVREIESPGDNCWDIEKSGDGVMTNYPFDKVTLACVDTKDGNGDSDGLLDFDIAIAWSNTEGAYDCDIDDPAKQPVPGTSSKCWYDANSRVTLNITVPDHMTPSAMPSLSLSPSSSPSRMPSSVPSLSPSLSSQPSNVPSMAPSLSAEPSSTPSLSPSLSIQPSLSQMPSAMPSKMPSSEPSMSPSLSSQPSEHPSAVPSFSSQPSFTPSLSPSISFQPSSTPSLSPSLSSQPSTIPSLSPSLSAQPSSAPSAIPTQSVEPSSTPSLSPSISSQPSSTPSHVPSSSPSKAPSASPTQLPSHAPSLSFTPSQSPSTSSAPSLSQAPSSHTAYPSSVPSLSVAPSTTPSLSPSISKRPTITPSEHPSASPSSSPTGNKYYPDWTNEEQVCKNDGEDPEYMKEVQRMNYLYISKEECCRNHFWWRITQCMANEHPLYYSTGSKCDQKVNFEDWEAKYTPADWSTSDLFDTLEDCCANKFWWDVQGCMDVSPKEMTFEFTFSLDGLVEPLYCQDADVIGNALEVALNIGLGSASDASSFVTGIGCAELSRDADTGNTVCGGCLSGSYTGDFDGTYSEDYLNGGTGSSTEITVEVSTTSDCGDATCIQALYDQMVADFTSYVTTGNLLLEIVLWALKRQPPVPELYNVFVVTDSVIYQDPTNPFNDVEATVEKVEVTTTGKFAVPTFDSQELAKVSVTTSGEFSVPYFDSATLTTQAAIDEATSYFENSVTAQLESQGLLPAGATVTVTSIDNGVVEYEIVMVVDSAADAATAVADINTSFADDNTMTAITSSVETSFSSSTNSELTAASSTVTLNTFTSGSATESAVEQVTTSGEFTVNNFDTSSFSTEEMAEASAYFEDAIAESLNLPEGATVQVTSISDGVVQYDIVLYVDPQVDAATTVSQIEQSLGTSSTLSVISSSVTDAASTSTTLSTAMASVNVASFTAGETVLNTEEAIAEATTYFQESVTQSLESQGLLPEGATVTITSIENGVVEYEIHMVVDSATDAATAVSGINSSLSSASILSSISSSVQSSFSSSSSTELQSASSAVTISSFAEGTTTESTVAQVTTSGEFAVNNFDTSSFSAAETAEATAYFEDAVAQSLTEQGLLPAGSTVTVTSIAGGVVQYDIVMNIDPAADANSLVTEINDSFSQSTIMQAISTSIQDAAGDSPTLSTSLSQVSVASFTAGTTAGVSTAEYYPDWINTKTCANDAGAPAFMKESPDVYLFSTKSECCETWFAFHPNCNRSTGQSTDLKFYPDWTTGICGQKQLKEFQVYEVAIYDSLDECCSDKFGYKREECCAAPGLGGCVATGSVKYLPDWSGNKCFAKSESSVANHEQVYAKMSVDDCCASYFSWMLSKCCTDSGGCTGSTS